MGGSPPLSPPAPAMQTAELAVSRGSWEGHVFWKAQGQGGWAPPSWSRIVSLCFSDTDSCGLTQGLKHDAASGRPRASSRAGQAAAARGTGERSCPQQNHAFSPSPQTAAEQGSEPPSPLCKNQMPRETVGHVLRNLKSGRRQMHTLPQVASGGRFL